MDFEATARLIWRQVLIVWNAPIPFIACLLLAIFVIWRLLQWQHGVRISHLNSQLELYREAHAVSADSAGSMRSNPAVQEEAPTGQPPEQTPSPAPVASPTEQKEFVSPDVTLTTITGLMKAGATTLAGEQAIEPYIGKWMNISARVVNIMTSGQRIGVSISTDEIAPNKLPIPHFFFNGDKDKLAALSPGNDIHAIGRLSGVSQVAIMLNNCELID